MTDIAVPYFHAHPATPPPWPGLVVVAEGNGMSPQLLRVCQRLAAEGYAVAAPDIFWRVGGSDPDRSMHRISEMRMRDFVADVSACVDVLRAGGCARVGVTGFCLGGRITYAAATWDGLELDAAVGFYGSGIDKKLGTPSCPTLLFYGGKDVYIPSDEIDGVRAHHGDDVIVYPDAQHGFMRDGSESYSPDAAADAWTRTIAFFGEHLATEAS